MKKLFKNKETFKPRDLFWLFIVYIIAAILWNSLLNLITWTKPELRGIVETIIIFEIIFVMRTLLFIGRKHLMSMYLDADTNKLVVTQLRPLRPDEITMLNPEEISVSEIKFRWFDHFELSDTNKRITISAGHYGMTEKKLKKLHKKLHSKLSIAKSAV